MYVLVGAHGSRTVRELGFHTSLQCLAAGRTAAGRSDATFGGAVRVLGAVFTNEDEKTGKHPVYASSFPCL